MKGDPLSVFFALLTVCIRDDPDSSRIGLLASTALSFTMGIATSVLTLYLLASAHLFF